MQYELGSSIEIKDLGPSCNRRHVRHSLPEVGGREKYVCVAALLQIPWPFFFPKDIYEFPI